MTSLVGRLVIALRCLEQFCAAASLTHPQLAEFRDHLWQLPEALETPDAFEVWFDGQPSHVMGDRDAALLAQAAARGVPADELTRLLDSVAEIVHGSFYAASDDAGSLQDLETVLRIVAQYGVRPPGPSLVADTRFSDGHGWGVQADAGMVQRWRIAQDAG